MKIIKNLVAVFSVIVGVVALISLSLLLFGYRTFIIDSQSMEPLYEKGSLCFVDTRVKLDSVKVGDVLVYRSQVNSLVLHRIVDIYFSDSERIKAVMQGDSTHMKQDLELNYVNFIGKAAFNIPRLGTLIDRIILGNFIWFVVGFFVILACV